MKNRKNKFQSILIIPHTNDPMINIRFPIFLKKFISISLIIILTIGSFIVFEYQMLFNAKEELYSIDLETQSLLEEYQQNYFTLYSDISTLQDDIITMSNLESEVRSLHNFNPNESYFSLENQLTLLETSEIEQKNQIIKSSIEQTKQTIATIQVAIPGQQASLNELIGLIENKNNTLLSIPSIEPTHGRISSFYGYRINPVDFKYRFHPAVDIANSPNTPIYATASGVVTYSSYTNNGYGYQILINHGNGYETFYAHNSRNLVSVGDYVKKGETIAYMGSTGKSTGSHLHYEVRLSGNTVNPMNYMN